MKAIGKCEVCGGKIIQAGNGNVFCEDCADKNFGERLQMWADRKEKQRIIRRARANERYSCDIGDTSILIKGLEDISNWDDEQKEWYDDPGHCATMTLIKYYNSKTKI